RFNCVNTSSMGRLFDAVASLVGICHLSSYEGQAAIELEMASDPVTTEAYRFDLSNGEEGSDELIMDPAPVFRSIVSDITRGISAGTISARFHAAVANCIREVCARVRSTAGSSIVALTGGVFQNVRLLDLSKHRLQRDGFKVLTHRLVPPNDGGLFLWQAAICLNFYGRQ